MPGESCALFPPSLPVHGWAHASSAPPSQSPVHQCRFPTRLRHRAGAGVCLRIYGPRYFCISAWRHRVYSLARWRHARYFWAAALGLAPRAGPPPPVALREVALASAGERRTPPQGPPRRPKGRPPALRGMDDFQRYLVSWQVSMCGSGTQAYCARIWADLHCTGMDKR